MRDDSRDYDYVPEDALAEILEEEERLYPEMFGRRPRRKKPYPSNRDVVEAIRDTLARAYGLHPDEFPELVLELLEERGFEVRHVTVKRIWRLYETLVRRGVISDALGVVGEPGPTRGRRRGR